MKWANEKNKSFILLYLLSSHCIFFIFESSCMTSTRVKSMKVSRHFQMFFIIPRCPWIDKESRQQSFVSAIGYQYHRSWAWIFIKYIYIAQSTSHCHSLIEKLKRDEWCRVALSRSTTLGLVLVPGPCAPHHSQNRSVIPAMAFFPVPFHFQVSSEKSFNCLIVRHLHPDLTHCY